MRNPEQHFQGSEGAVNHGDKERVAEKVLDDLTQGAKLTQERRKILVEGGFEDQIPSIEAREQERKLAQEATGTVPPWMN